MKVRWTIVKSSEPDKPTTSETWHLVADVPAARLGIQKWISENMPQFANVPSWRQMEGVNRTRIDFGSKLYLGLIVREV